MVFVKKLRQAWQGQPEGTTVVVADDQVHGDLVKESVVHPDTEVRALIREWQDPEGTTHAPGTRVRLDAATVADLEEIGVLGPTAH